MLQQIVKTLGRYLARRALPGPAPRRRLRGLREAVDVIRDGHGVPHIFAWSAHDLFFAQGWVHAESRLWQMDLLRRAAGGRLSEIFGDVPVSWEEAGVRWRGRRMPELDRWLLILGLRRAAEASVAKAGGEVREAVEAYAAGVNRFIESARRDGLPVEMRLLAYEPDPWTAADSFCIAKIMALESCYALRHKLALVVLAERLQGDQDRLRELFPRPYAKDAPRTSSFKPPAVPSGPPEPGGAGERSAALLRADGQFRDFLGWGPPAGTNWCVLGPERTTTGKPILVNDPHLRLTAPCVFFPNHLAGGPYDVTGGSIPGAPGVVLGHNRRIAWAMSNIEPDDADLYLETPHPLDPYRYIVPEGAAIPAARGVADASPTTEGRYAPFELERHEIRVRGERAPRRSVVRISRHGPILSDAFLEADAVAAAADGAEVRFARGPLLALRWTAHIPSSELDALLAVNRARAWPEFVGALRRFVSPAHNFAYADVDGNIGWVAAGRLPIRAGGKNILPADGSRGEGEWTGFVPFEENPHLFNPKTGYIANSNNKLVDDAYPHYIGDFHEPSYRARRVHQIVREKDRLSPDDAAELMLDVRSLQAQELIDSAVRPIEDRLKSGAGGEVQVALNYLLNWDFQCTTDSIAATVFHVFYDALLGEIFREPLGEVAFTSFIEGGYQHIAPVDEVLKDPRSAWFRDRPRDEVVARALSRAVARIEWESGKATADWAWGRRHRVTCRHAFHAKAPLRKLFDIGPEPAPGSWTTVNKALWNAAFPFAAIEGPCFRHLAHLGDLEGGSRFSLPGGASGNPASPHRDDLFRLWIEGRWASMPMSRSAVEAAAEGRVALVP